MLVGECVVIVVCVRGAVPCMLLSVLIYVRGSGYNKLLRLKLVYMKAVTKSFTVTFFRNLSIVSCLFLSLLNIFFKLGS